jgi:hypothetical protein
MKKLLFVLFLSSCSPSILKHAPTEGFSHVGTDVYYMGEKCATMTSLEMAYDNNKIVRECTLIITDEKFDQYALNIIKYMRKKVPHWEVEVELKKTPVP